MAKIKINLMNGSEIVRDHVTHLKFAFGSVYAEDHRDDYMLPILRCHADIEDVDSIELLDD